ncbi:hypothetical protein [Brevibacillus laterosporus]|uniref:hypothetical protein n=1 Tax=Brevibacillus laterosporus TaxID=1465 RepID=UPI0026534F3F|nr:hypothetical protein [Brevibacillus laterosporus]MDN9011185.1 hypothetical protein [Brevibacillus laterosporus]MDO0942208.1 hypothetical protein [Brevibacillus laterosporus]
MKDKLKYHLEKANLYGMLAKFYEHMNPDKHIYYYKKHFYHEQKVVEYHQCTESSYSNYMYESC